MSSARSFINAKTQTYESLKAGLVLSRNERAKFDVLNAHIVDSVVLPGELVILGDPITPGCTSHEAYLMNLAISVHRDVLLRGPGADDFLLENFDLLKSLLPNASLGIGVVSGAWSKHLDRIHATLLEIESLYREYLGKGTLKARDEFYAKRSALFLKLGEQLDNMASYGSRLRRESSVKRTLNISTKSYLHTGEIAEYAEKLSGVAKASKLLKMGTPIGISLDVTMTGVSIYKACTLGREEECREAKYVEWGALVGGVGEGFLLGAVGSTAASSLCVALGFSTYGLGTFFCGIAGGAVGGMVGGALGSNHGEFVGKYLYERVGD
ncbi:TPA: hypothetical protein ACOJM5_003335 [Pseudomonas putida]